MSAELPPDEPPVEEPVDEPPDGPAAADGPDLARSALDAARAAARQAPRRRRRRPRHDPGRLGGFTGPGADENGPQPLGELVRQVVTDRGWERQAADASVMGRWAELVGADIAQHCQPASLRDGELVVVAESTAWATQLRLLTPRLLAALAAGVGPGVVRRLRVQGPTTPTWTKGPRRVQGRGPRDTYG